VTASKLGSTEDVLQYKRCLKTGHDARMMSSDVDIPVLPNDRTKPSAVAIKAVSGLNDFLRRTCVINRHRALMQGTTKGP